MGAVGQGPGPVREVPADQSTGSRKRPSTHKGPGASDWYIRETTIDASLAPDRRWGVDEILCGRRTRHRQALTAAPRRSPFSAR
jgi:hypothetical protein